MTTHPVTQETTASRPSLEAMEGLRISPFNAIPFQQELYHYRQVRRPACASFSHLLGKRKTSLTDTGHQAHRQPSTPTPPVRGLATLAQQEDQADDRWCPAYQATAAIACPFGSFKDYCHSLFKVLFIFPSRYLFAIGLLQIFSFR